MKISLKINSREGSENSRPVYIHIQHKGKRKKFVLLRTEEKFWNNGNFLKSCPNYYEMQPFIASLKAKFFEWELLKDVTQVKNEILEFQNDYFSVKNIDSCYLSDFADNFINNIQNEGNKKVYNAFLIKVNSFCSHLQMCDIDYNLVQSFSRFLKEQGLKKNSISNYLRSFRAIYNEYIRQYKAEDKKPFENAFNGLMQKYTIKKYLEFSEIEKLESASFDTTGKQRARDLFLLMFYLGGLNFKDLYFLKSNQIHNDRIFLRRSKTDSFEFDLKIFPKAKVILEKYQFPLGDNYKSYETAKRNLYRSLQLVQKELDIFVAPKGEKLGINVARHTFSTLGVKAGANREIKALLMGHEIGDIQAYYETYSADFRDREHEKIIYFKEDR